MYLLLKSKYPQLQYYFKKSITYFNIYLKQCMLAYTYTDNRY